MRFCANGGGVHAEFDDDEELDVFFSCINGTTIGPEEF